MVYQQCGSLCPQTCDNVRTSNCHAHGGCAEGCFCPDGQVLYNGRCIHPIVCPGLYKYNSVLTMFICIMNETTYVNLLNEVS